MVKSGFLLSAKAILAFALVWPSAQVCFADNFAQVNLVSDIPGLAGTYDPNLKNPWGVSFFSLGSVQKSPFWISNQASGTSTLYDGAGNKIPLTVTIPGGNPTGQVFNGVDAFDVPTGPSTTGPAHFIFDTLEGTIVGWGSPASGAHTMATTPGALYTGLALASSGGSPYLYAADATGSVRVFNSSFQPATLTGNFTDPSAMSGFVPFNIQLINGNLFVTYASLTAAGTANPGGYIDEYSTSGTFIARFATGGALDGPWGLAVSPSGFGSFGNDLLVGNFGNGEILAYSMSGNFLGILDGQNGQPLDNPFIWALDFGTGGANTTPGALYFTAGYNSQKDGLFGMITFVPEPASIALLLLGAGALAIAVRKGMAR